MKRDGPWQAWASWVRHAGDRPVHKVWPWVRRVP